MKKWLLLLCLSGCDDLELYPHIGADAAREGLPGEMGPWGAASWDVRVRTRATDEVPLTFYVPVDDQGGPIGGQVPVVVFSHGGLVAPHRYHWIAEHLATRGYAVVFPTYPSLLGILTPGNSITGLDAFWDEVEDDDSPLDGYADRGAPVAVAGHSLGGVVAAMHFEQDEDIDALLMQASFPSRPQKVADVQDGRPVLGITGSTDSISPSEFRDEWSAFGSPFASAVVQGMNHYAWTDDVLETERGNRKDGELKRPIDAVRDDAWIVMDGFLDASLKGDEEAWTYVLDNLPSTVDLEATP